MVCGLGFRGGNLDSGSSHGVEKLWLGMMWFHGKSSIGYTFFLSLSLEIDCLVETGECPCDGSIAHLPGQRPVKWQAIISLSL